jgi:hypothetical protein
MQSLYPAQGQLSLVNADGPNRQAIAARAGDTDMSELLIAGYLAQKDRRIEASASLDNGSFPDHCEADRSENH